MTKFDKSENLNKNFKRKFKLFFKEISYLVKIDHGIVYIVSEALFLEVKSRRSSEHSPRRDKWRIREREEKWKTKNYSANNEEREREGKREEKEIKWVGRIEEVENR